MMITFGFAAALDMTLIGVSLHLAVNFTRCGDRTGDGNVV